MANTGQAGRSGSRSLAIKILAAVVLIGLVAAAGTWYFQVRVPHDEAVKAFEVHVQRYEEAVSGLEARNADLDRAISDLQTTIDSEQPPLDPKLLLRAGATIGEVQSDVAEAPPSPRLPDETDEIREETDRLPALIAEVEALGNYEEQVARLESAQAAIEASIEQMQQVTNPSEAFVIQRI